MHASPSLQQRQTTDLWLRRTHPLVSKERERESFSQLKRVKNVDLSLPRSTSSQKTKNPKKPRKNQNIKTASSPGPTPLASPAPAPRKACSPLPSSPTSTTRPSSPASPFLLPTRPCRARRRSSASKSAALPRTISSRSGGSTTSRWRAGAWTRACSRGCP